MRCTVKAVPDYTTTSPYHFDAEFDEIDFARILRENAESHIVYVTVGTDPEQTVLFLSSYAKKLLPIPAEKVMVNDGHGSQRNVRENLDVEHQCPSKWIHGRSAKVDNTYGAKLLSTMEKNTLTHNRHKFRVWAFSIDGEPTIFEIRMAPRKLTSRVLSAWGKAYKAPIIIVQITYTSPAGVTSKRVYSFVRKNDLIKPQDTLYGSIPLLFHRLDVASSMSRSRHYLSAYPPPNKGTSSSWYYIAIPTYMTEPSFRQNVATWAEALRRYAQIRNPKLTRIQEPSENVYEISLHKKHATVEAAFKNFSRSVVGTAKWESGKWKLDYQTGHSCRGTVMHILNSPIVRSAIPEVDEMSPKRITVTHD